MNLLGVVPWEQGPKISPIDSRTRGTQVQQYSLPKPFYSTIMAPAVLSSGDITPAHFAFGSLGDLVVLVVAKGINSFDYEYWCSCYYLYFV